MAIPYYFMIATWLPIFLIIYFVPGHAESAHHLDIQSFIDRHLLGLVGMWSSSFPLSSLLVVNYVSLSAPIFSLFFIHSTLKNSIFQKNQLDKLPTLKALAYIMATNILIVILFYTLYIGSSDLANARRLSFIGRNEFLYACFLSGIMYLYYIISLASFLTYRVLPGVIIRSYVKQHQK